MEEVEEQHRLEKLRYLNSLSPRTSQHNLGPSPSVTEATESNKQEQGQTTASKGDKSKGFTYSCPFCSITFKYRKVS